MPLKQYKISGVNVFDKQTLRYQNFIKPDIVTMVSMTLYLLKDLEWIDEIFILPGRFELEIICDIKENFEMDYVRKVMKEGIILIREHIKEFELETTFHTIADIRYVRILYWGNQSQLVKEKLAGKG